MGKKPVMEYGSKVTSEDMFAKAPARIEGHDIGTTTTVMRQPKDEAEKGITREAPSEEVSAIVPAKIKAYELVSASLMEQHMTPSEDMFAMVAARMDGQEFGNTAALMEQTKKDAVEEDTVREDWIKEDAVKNDSRWAIRFRPPDSRVGQDEINKKVHLAEIHEEDVVKTVPKSQVYHSEIHKMNAIKTVFREDWVKNDSMCESQFRPPDNGVVEMDLV